MNEPLTQERYRLLGEHFQACINLPEPERGGYVSKISATDPNLALELESLLKHHTPRPEKGSRRRRPAADSPGPVAWIRRRWNRLSALAVFLASLGGAVIGILALQFWTVGHLEVGLRREAAQHLAEELDFRVAQVRSWAARQADRARGVLQEPELLSQVKGLLALAQDREGLKERLLASPFYRAVSARLLQVSPELGGEGFIVMTPTGVLLCAETEAMVAKHTNVEGSGYIRRVILGEWVLSRPYPDRQFALGMTPQYDHPMMFVAGPIRDESDRTIALGFFRFSPRPFDEFFAADSSEFLAFDEKGLVVSPVANASLLERAGLIPLPAGAGGRFRIHLNDPGIDLEQGPPPDPRPESWVPTVMSRSGVQGFNRTDEVGHRDFRGKRVLASWRWLPEWEMGMGAQIPLVRVLAPVRPVKQAFALLLGGVGLMAGLLATLSYVRSERRLRKDDPLSSYRMDRQIGKGGMAKIYLAHHRVLGRPTALKILDEVHPSPAAVERFEREARLASRLGHPNTIQIFDYGKTADGRLTYAMEYVEGLNLAQLLSLEGPLPVARAVFLLGQIAAALEEAHELGLLHRDLKPSNIMVSKKGGMGDLIKVLDFGIACSLRSDTDEVARSTSLVGTPAYIAPERIRAPGHNDPRSDIYSFGAVAFHLLTGRTVFEGPGPTELIYQVMTAPRPSASQFRGERLPDSLERLVADCLSIEPEYRPPDFRRVIEILSAVETRDRWEQDEARAWWATNQSKVNRFLAAVS
jgi:hypothetical protein